MVSHGKTSKCDVSAFEPNSITRDTAEVTVENAMMQ